MGGQVAELDMIRRKRYAYRWIILIITFCVMWEINVAAIIPLINYFFISTKDAEVLAQRLKESTGAHETPLALFNDKDSIKDILVEDALITAWDLNERSPRTFSKWAYDNLANDPAQVSNLKLIDMI